MAFVVDCSVTMARCFVDEANPDTEYDATYLELAARLGLPLATQGTRLQAAAATLGLPLLPPQARLWLIANF